MRRFWQWFLTFVQDEKPAASAIAAELVLDAGVEAATLEDVS